MREVEISSTTIHFLEIDMLHKFCLSLFSFVFHILFSHLTARLGFLNVHNQNNLNAQLVAELVFLGTSLLEAVSNCCTSNLFFRERDSRLFFGQGSSDSEGLRVVLTVHFSQMSSSTTHAQNGRRHDNVIIMKYIVYSILLGSIYNIP